MAMTLQKGLEHIKDSIDCQVDGARSLKSIMRAYPTLKPQIQSVLDSMEKVKQEVKSIESALIAAVNASEAQ